MMQQILRDMFVDPELLAELNEEQRQILFYKIRQEQVRRWTECEIWFSHLPLSWSPENRKSVQWLQGRDGEVWVWVMGDAPGDKPYEMIVKELMEERARRQAQLEAQELWIFQQSCMQSILYQFFSILPSILSISSFLVRRSKEADEEMTRKARWARDEYKRQSLRAIEKGHVAGLSGHFQKQSHRRHSTFIEPSVSPVSSNEVRPRPGLQRAEPPLYRPAWVRTPRPNSREMVILWFTEEQKPKQAGYERNSNAIAPWFHGKINRLVSVGMWGSFLVRVSDRIWGYTLSYRTASGFKHFLIDASRDYYSFLGVDQNRHATLADLIDFHKVKE
uniref:SH2 domain containing 4Ba n=1 Tax=Cyprinus carpio TaxID=7962 RepID=A0A8C1VNJ1_CYPCA